MTAHPTLTACRPRRSGCASRQEPSTKPTTGKRSAPTVSERAWGTVREDYSADGNAWEYFTYEHARSRAYRWSEDGLAGICDRNQKLCFALAVWNGQDPFIKERMFGLDQWRGQPRRGRQGILLVRRRDADGLLAELALPLSAGRLPLREVAGRKRQAQPQGARIRAFRHRDLRRRPLLENRGRVREGGSIRSLHSHSHSQRRARKRRNSWFSRRSGIATVGPGMSAPSGRRSSRSNRAPLTSLARAPSMRRGERWRLAAGPDPRGALPELLFCENETNVARLFGGAPQSPYPKDGVNDHVVSGAATVNPDRRGTKMACQYTLEAGPGQELELRLRLTRDGATATMDLGEGLRRRRSPRASRKPTNSMRLCGRPAQPTRKRRSCAQAFAGLIWSQQFYHFDVKRWLDGDPTQPAPPPGDGAYATPNGDIWTATTSS